MNTEAPAAHILVVDDEPKVRLLLRRCFEPEGFTVSEAENRESALKCLSEEQIDLDKREISPNDIYRVGVLCKVVKKLRLPDGSTNILVQRTIDLLKLFTDKFGSGSRYLFF